MSELVFLRSKAYAFKVNGKEVKKLKGITKSTIKHDITFQDVKDAITEPYEKIFYKKMYVLNSDKHEMYVKEMIKKAISPYDDKRWISEELCLFLMFMIIFYLLKNRVYILHTYRTSLFCFNSNNLIILMIYVNYTTCFHIK